MLLLLCNKKVSVDLFQPESIGIIRVIPPEKRLLDEVRARIPEDCIGAALIRAEYELGDGGNLYAVGFGGNSQGDSVSSHVKALNPEGGGHYVQPVYPAAYILI